MKTGRYSPDLAEPVASKASACMLRSMLGAGGLAEGACEQRILHTLIDSIPDQIYVKDTEGRFVLCNKTVAGRYGYDNPDDMIGLTDFDFFPADIAAEYRKIERKIVETGEPTLGRETHGIDADGREKWALMTKMPLRDDCGNTLGIVGINTNITKRKHAEDTMKRESNFLDALLNSIPDAVYCKDIESRFVKINKACAQVLGLQDPMDAVGKADFDFSSLENAARLRDEEWHIIRTGKPLISKEQASSNASSPRKWTLNTKVPWRDGDGDIIGIIGVNRDITPLKQAQQKKSELFSQLRNANNELHEFARVVSHDLKAPLRGIKILADWLACELPENIDDNAYKRIRLLCKRVRRMQNLIDGILSYSSVGFLKEQVEAIDLEKLIPEIIDSVAPPDNISVTVEGKLPEIRFEKTRITQVFQNLISNAVKYMNKPQGKVCISCRDVGKFYEFSVADNGPGINRKYFRKIFKMFQTLARRDDYESTGLGLTLVKKIVELYGGRIWLESKEAEGSTFFFTVPKRT